ncbi:ubiquinol-cytochrome-c reductase complex assembly factor 2 [Ixodes scapularis]|uniref:ubiquinol-cytochrome-c reductase complex assembly factor 2 n=1 Tax=Ixodes scapularis TaxID=6945 RepID=UPI001A9F949F|nr:ubiquinol-cytochrome-c reductase complex assembly factor 2 [Ixodes scapularis]
MAAASLYREYMKLCSVWHADPTRKGKCLGEFIRKRVAEEFRQSEQTVLRDPADCVRRLKSLQAISANTHSSRYPRLSASSASSLTRAECSQLIFENLHAVGKAEEESSLLDNLRERFSFRVVDGKPKK